MKRIPLLLTFSVSCLASLAQTSSDFMQAMKKASVDITFDVTASGKEYKVNWGMDAAWDWDYNVNLGVAHIGKGNFATGRVSFQPIDLVTDNGDGTYTLTERQQKKLKWRCDLIKKTGTKKVNLNCDHEALFCKVDENGNYPEETRSDGKSYKITDYTGRTNYRGKPQQWYRLIKASVAYVQSQGLTVVSISPFNEPDYVWEQATSEAQAKVDFKSIAKLLKEDNFFEGIRVCGGNTLNNDKAWDWYTYLKNYLDEGNTHQLAGSFDSYANFFTKVKENGKVATADELHNVGEAIVGVNYGMENGIWWGFDAKARGQFCLDSNEGVRIGYGENRTAWTDAAVYRNEVTGEVHGYIGSSERQALASSFAFVSTTQDVYFNGYGPTRMYVYDVPGGKSGDYQSAAQINAERLFDITWGEDVAPFPVNGTYQVKNASTHQLLTWSGNNPVFTSSRKTSGTTQHWNVTPGYTSGDISYWFIDNVSTTSKYTHLNLLNKNFSAGAQAICWTGNETTGAHFTEEQWYVKYAKNGYFYIISRISNKYLYDNSGTVTLQNTPTSTTSAAELNKYLWRFQSTDARANDTTLPQAPKNLNARQRPASIELTWTASTSSDVDSYIVLRAEAPEEEGGTPQYNTIGRGVKVTTFVDNTVVAGKQYLYRVVAVDKAGNRSATGRQPEILAAAPTSEKTLIGQWQFDGTLTDLSANHLNLSLSATPTYSQDDDLVKSGTSSLYFNGTTYGMLPYSVGQHDEMTLSAWVYWNGGSDWQRIFDFGNDTDHYMFLCPRAGNEMRFVFKNGGDEQILSANKLDTETWFHLAVTIQPVGDKVSAILYLNGTAVAQKDDFTIHPSDIAPSLCYIGRSIFSVDPMYKGYIDDLRIYNHALSADEVASVMTDLGEQSKDLSDDYEEAIPTAIEAPYATIHQQDGRSGFDLNGRPATATDKGILIQNGKKVYKR